MTTRRLFHRLLALVRSARLDAELDDEVQAHLEMAEHDAIAAGLSLEDARREARRRFGGVERVREEHRDSRSVRWIDTLGEDLRHGLQLLRRDPLFSAIAIAVMALGIGATAAMFSIVDAVLLKPLPYPEPDRIVRVWEAPSPTTRNGTTTLNFLDWKRLNTSFEAMSAVRGLTVSLTGAGEAVRLKGLLVSADFFDVFGVKPMLGRTFRPADDEPGANHVIVLSHATWTSTFGADPDILRRKVMLDGEAHDVIGVLPPVAFDWDRPAFWRPIAFAPEQRTRDNHWLGAVARLRAGVTVEQAREEMRAISAGLSPLQPPFKRNWSSTVERFDSDLVTDTLRQSVVVGFGAVVMVLLIAVANLANLLLAKGVTRRREMAVRAALGATRSRLVSQVLAESLVLCAIGGSAGVGLAYLLLTAAAPLVAASLPGTAAVAIDPRVLVFTAAVTIVVSMLIGFLPSLQLSARGITDHLHASARGASSRQGVRPLIVVAEVAVSVVLVCGAVLMIMSLARLQRIDPGVRVENVITMSLDLPLATYPNTAAASQFIETAAVRLQGLPGVESAAVSTDLPMLGVRQVEGLSIPGTDDTMAVRFKRVDPGYFSTLDIPVLAGRPLTSRDRPGAPRVVVINEMLARQLAERFQVSRPADTVGRVIRLSVPGYENRGQAGAPQDMEIVGMIRDERVRDLESPMQEVVYVPLLQIPRREIRFIVRTASDPATLVPAIRDAVKDIDPHSALGDVRTMAEVKRLTMSTKADSAWILGSFAIVASLLAALGLYGVLSHSVNQRRREIGIRMALGAATRNVLAHVLRHAALMIVAGLLLGIAGSYMLTGVIRTLLFDVSPLDPVAFGAATAAIALVGLLAALIPAGRAARVDPVTALRTEG